MDYVTKLRALLVMRHLTQKELAQRVGVHPNTISRVMTGDQKPDLELAFLLADALEVSLDYLTSDSSELEPTGRRMHVRDEDFVILEVSRSLGYQKALARLTHATTPPPEAEGPGIMA